MITQDISEIPQKLVDAANAVLDWHWQETEVGGVDWHMAVASDPDAMLVEACERQDAGEEGVIDPFWATTWRAAAGLDRFLQSIDVKGKSILELGCGTGHVGIAAAIRGADVVLTDGVEDPLHLVRMSSYPVRSRCQIQRLRFGQDELPERFPILLGSDVTYLRQLWPELLECIEQHLAPDGVVFLSDPCRIIGNEFREWIKPHPFDYVEHKVQMDDDPEHPIRVMELRREAVN
ncbi:class I SAM-dependent methyltransferase [Roseiconus lacunae]|uniref:Methyltransferase domain-containing protein n=1 Tax=Roseiconus lacunae TaxID=2605694 RepID=A0ABT7PBH4_9BACT|nr:methyltransferase domain-containing protein [Roseiconus lacunae]MDM4013850.1 methyltransferase domain-containing protein [Roseiconus lacunae]